MNIATVYYSFHLFQFLHHLFHTGPAADSFNELALTVVDEVIGNGIFEIGDLHGRLLVFGMTAGALLRSHCGRTDRVCANMGRQVTRVSKVVNRFCLLINLIRFRFSAAKILFSPDICKLFHCFSNSIVHIVILIFCQAATKDDTILLLCQSLVLLISLVVLLIIDGIISLSRC